MANYQTTDCFKSGNSEFKLNQRNKANGLRLLQALKDESVRIVFFDPQYRGVLDKLSYGNEGKSRGQTRSAPDERKHH